MDVNAVERLISSIEESGEPIDEYDIVKRLTEAFEGGEKPFEAVAEIIAFSLEENYLTKPGSWGFYFGPSYIIPNSEGGALESPSIKAISCEMIEYWKTRSHDSVNPVLKARYSDLVWELEAEICSNRPDHTFARIAVDAYINTAVEKAHKYDVQTIDKLKRALYIAISLNDRDLIGRVRSVILDYEDAIAVDSMRGLWGFSFDCILCNKNTLFTSEQRDKIIADLEERLERTVNPDEGAPDPWIAEAAATRLASYYRRMQSDEDTRRVMSMLGSAFMKAIKSSSSIQALALVHHLHSLYVSYNLNDAAGALSTIINEVGEKAREEMKEFKYTHTIPQEDVERFLEQMMGDSLDEAFHNCIASFIPSKEKVEDQLTKISEQYVSVHLATKVVQDHRGRPVAVIGTIDDDPDGHIVMTIAQNMISSSFFLNILINNIIDVYSIDAELLCSRLFECPLIQEYQRGLIKLGIVAYFEHEYSIAIHILIPQLEAMIRNLAELSGIPTLRRNKYGGFHNRLLNEFLECGLISSTFNSDVDLYFRVLLTDQRGWNLRNQVCHGLQPSESYTEVQCDRLLHALLLVSVLRERE